MEHRVPQTLQHLFVCGCGHSGTTLLVKMLGCHDLIYSIPFETRIFFDMTLSAQGAREVFEMEFYPFVRAKGATVLCEKTPMHIRYINLIREAFPGCLFVIPVRDPRDVALSIKSRTGSLAEGYGRWIHDNSIVRREMDFARSDIVVFRYEDFIDDVEAIHRRICRRLAIPFDAAMLDHRRDARHWFQLGEGQVARSEPPPTDHESFRDWQVQQPLLERRGRWRTLLDPAEIAEVESHCDELMETFGYDLCAP